MPRTADDVETYLYRLNRTFEKGEGGLFMVSSGSEGPPIVVYVDDPIVVVRVDIGKVPKDEKMQLALFRQLLEFNGKGLVQASYALEGDNISLSAGLQLENIDMNEMAAVLADIDLALALHLSTLRELVTL
jgi:CesT_Tir_1